MNKLNNGITVRILGDFGPFSVIGKSIGYEITIGQSHFLIDCGTPLFQQIGSVNLQNIKGLFISHCHDDHKRWFTDIALFNMYATNNAHKVPLFTSEDIYDELFRASGPSLDRSLGNDSKTIVDIAYEEYINYRTIGPRARYRICTVDEGKGKTGVYIKDTHGNLIGPDQAKIVINKKTDRPRMLFKDPDHGEWVEPESYYPFASDVFYENDKNIYSDPEGYFVEAIKAPVWHGITNIGFRITTGEETLVFSSDTNHDLNLWEKLYKEKRAQTLHMSKKEFNEASVIYGDINDYIERTWSKLRYEEAVNSFNDSVVIHDISTGHSIVHTDYESLKHTTLKKDRTILTHSPDYITSEWPLCHLDKKLRIKGKDFYELVDDKLYPIDAEIYHKEGSRYYVGYKNEKGSYIVYEKNNSLRLSTVDKPDLGKPLYRIDLFEDISGRYFPKLERDNAIYFERKDSKVELIHFNEAGSTGQIVENQRDELSKQKNSSCVKSNLTHSEL